MSIWDSVVASGIEKELRGCREELKRMADTLEAIYKPELVHYEYPRKKKFLRDSVVTPDAQRLKREAEEARERERLGLSPKRPE